MPWTRDHSAKRRRAILAAVLVLDLCLANACLLAGGARPAVAQQSEADVFVAQAILAYDARTSQWQKVQGDDTLRARRLPTGVTMRVSIEGRDIVLPRERARAASRMGGRI